ncbi:hypothetical protein KBC75_01980 [Candidatus Shapirobacteria bacterium]|nr:hypothetical protein [Candidatus Shapirobacteria bacterium]
MLEKRDKLKKSTQLPLEEKDSGPSSTELLQRKRRLVIILLIITIGLSLLFWAYRTLRYFQIPKFKLPQVSSSLQTLSSNKSNISEIISKDSSSWSIFFLPKKLKPYTYNIDPAINDAFAAKQIDLLTKLKTPPTNLLVDVLPEGLTVKDILTETSDQIIYQAIVNIPNNQIYFYIKINGQNLSESKKNIPTVIESYYWSVIKNL